MFEVNYTFSNNIIYNQPSLDSESCSRYSNTFILRYRRTYSGKKTFDRKFMNRLYFLNHTSIRAIKYYSY